MITAALLLLATCPAQAEAPGQSSDRTAGAEVVANGDAGDAGEAAGVLSSVDDTALAASGLSPADVAIANRIGETISTTDFLGPMAPVALSPFFGIACLSALAQFGPESMVEANGLLASSSPLKNPWLLGIFATLAVLTSLPRLTKVSKPIAGALDQVEAWSGIVTMIAIKLLAGGAGGGELAASLAEPVYVAGIGTLTLDVLLSIAAAVNVIVVNSVKFFFEFLVWITPIPFLDACFETANKVTCAALMGLYAFSPFASFVLNVILFLACAIAFIWIRRQIVFFRTLLFDWLLGWVREPAEASIGSKPLTVFPRAAFGPFAARDRLLLERTESGYRITRPGFLRRGVEVEVASESGQIEPGWVAHTLEIDSEEVQPLLFSRRYRRSLSQLANAFRVELREEAVRDKNRRKAELSGA